MTPIGWQWIYCSLALIDRYLVIYKSVLSSAIWLEMVKLDALYTTYPARKLHHIHEHSYSNQRVLHTYWYLWHNLSSSIHLTGCFIHGYTPLEQKIKIVTMDHLNIIFYQLSISDNLPMCWRMGNWFSFQCLVPWMYYLLPVQWSTFAFKIQNKESLVYQRGISEQLSCFDLCLFTCIYLSFSNIFQSNNALRMK